MKLLISNQHGALVMALIPFLYGILLTGPIPQHLFLLFAWLSIYLMSYPLLNLFKGKNTKEYRKWTVIYGASSVLFAIPVLMYDWHIIVFIMAMCPFLFINIYFTKAKDERNLWNDLAGLAIFAIAGMGAYYFPGRIFDEKIYWVAIYPSLFFIGTTLYIKSVMRERKNPNYLYSSIIFHLLCVVGFLIYREYVIAIGFLLALIRAIYLPYKHLPVKQTGVIEFIISGIFFIILLITAL
ncbi:YwiC-like family protein [Rodentibacter caecimuris]|uniref:YwiC-like family protein n=1 Tax=Rodentibacter caecimuris TaxID=1796644 RepID=A0ABX3KYD0_9PAST|nr:hypothetical protein BKG89_05475 [Rodentibacter heylii]